MVPVTREGSGAEATPWLSSARGAGAGQEEGGERKTVPARRPGTNGGSETRVCGPHGRAAAGVSGEREEGLRRSGTKRDRTSQDEVTETRLENPEVLKRVARREGTGLGCLSNLGDSEAVAGILLTPACVSSLSPVWSLLPRGRRPQGAPAETFLYPCLSPLPGTAAASPFESGCLKTDHGAHWGAPGDSGRRARGHRMNERLTRERR